MNGLVSGGWSFVWAAYAITAFVLVTVRDPHVHRGARNTLIKVRWVTRQR